jgi:hypothetical protein
MARPKGTTAKKRASRIRDKDAPKKTIVKKKKTIVKKQNPIAKEELKVKEVIIKEPIVKEEIKEEPIAKEVIKKEPIKVPQIEDEYTLPIKENKTNDIEITESKKEDMSGTAEIQEDIPMQTFNPLSEELVERDYTKEMIEKDMGGSSQPQNNSGFEEMIPEPSYDIPSYNIDEEGNTPTSSTESNGASVGGGQSSEPKAPINPATADMPSGEKRKAAKKTAEALLSTYARVFPFPFKKIASFNMSKMERLQSSGEIDLNMPVTNDGTTVKQHFEGVNKQVDEVFTVTEEMQEELREPLVDLLMEQELALSPTQRLLIVFGGQAVQFTTATIQIALQNKQALEQFKEFHAERGGNRPQPQAQPQPQPQAQPQQQAPPQHHQENESYSTPTASVEEESYDSPDSFSMDDYLDGNTENKIASVENGGITQENVPNE